MMIRSKKGQIFSMGLCILVFWFLIYIYIILGIRQTTSIKEGQIGDDAALLLSSHAISDQTQLYYEQATALSVEQALSELARRGGMAEQDKCGIANSYSLWSTADNKLEECFPDFKQSFSRHFAQTLNSQLANFQTYDWQPIDARRYHDISLVKEDEGLFVIITTPEPIQIPVKSKSGKQAMTITVYPSAKTRIPDLNADFNGLREGAKAITDQCKASTELIKCATGQVYKLNTAPGAVLKWKAGPCAGDIAVSDPRILQFCVQADQRILTKKAASEGGDWIFTPMLYRFALTLTRTPPVSIINFQANGIPDTGNPKDKGGFGLSKGQPISYHGRIAAPALEGLEILICYSNKEGKNCQPVPKDQWRLETYPSAQQLSVFGTLQPQSSPPFVLTLEAKRKAQSDSTAGIDIVKVPWAQ